MHLLCTLGAEPFFWDQSVCCDIASLLPEISLALLPQEFVDVFSVG